MLLWGVALTSGAPALGPLWHGHEMIFGYTGAVIAGFVLTAASNWTGRATLTGLPLAALVLAWVAARIVVPAESVPDGVKAALCAGFFIYLAYGVGRPILAMRQRRNYGVVLVLIVLAALELLFWLTPFLRSRVLVAALMFILILVAVIGGRIIPAFTRNATPGLEVRPGGQWRDWLAMGLLAVLGLFVLCPADPGWLMATLSILAAVTHALRMRGWGGIRTLDRPILWVLQLAYLFLPLGLGLYAARDLGAPVPFWVPLHVLAVGALGLMTLGMMGRVSLGHTGRTIVAGKLTVFSYGLLAASAIARGAGGLFEGEDWKIAMLTAVGLWSLAFLLFLLVHAHMLLAPRVDGKHG